MAYWSSITSRSDEDLEERLVDGCVATTAFIWHPVTPVPISEAHLIRCNKKPVTLGGQHTTGDAMTNVSKAGAAVKHFGWVLYDYRGSPECRSTPPTAR